MNKKIYKLVDSNGDIFHYYFSTKKLAKKGKKIIEGDNAEHRKWWPYGVLDIKTGKAEKIEKVYFKIKTEWVNNNNYHIWNCKGYK